jgi:hypothetical protein
VSETAPFIDQLIARDNVRPLLVDINSIVRVTVTIDWDMLDPKWHYAAMDGNGAVYVFTHEPVKVTQGWQKLMGDALMIAPPYTRRWAETLQSRDDGR